MIECFEHEFDQPKEGYVTLFFDRIRNRMSEPTRGFVEFHQCGHFCADSPVNRSCCRCANEKLSMPRNFTLCDICDAQ